MFPLILSACVSIDVHGLVSETAQVTEDAYQALAGKKSKPDGAASDTAGANGVIAHFYLGSDGQTADQIREQCVAQAAKLLALVDDKEVPYTVMENEIVTIKGKVAANCKLAVKA